MGSWNDFNDAQSNTNLIPKGTLAKVRLTIRPGGFDDASQGWTGGYATRGSTGAVYLNGEFTATFAHRRKIFLVSTPTIRGLSRVEREYDASDQRRFFVPCPHCGHAQWLKFDRLRWQKGRPETAEYHCEGCEQPASPERAAHA